MARPSGIAADLQHYLRQSRDAVLRAVDGASEYDIRRPLTPTGTNLLGLIKHLAGIEFSYLGDCVGRPPAFVLPWVADGSIWDNADMWVTADEPRDYILDVYRQAGAHSDQSIAALPLDHPAHVEWWAEGQRVTTFGHLLTRVVAETAQHAGHADILREELDGRGGVDQDELGDSTHWNSYVAGIQAAAERYRSA